MKHPWKAVALTAIISMGGNPCFGQENENWQVTTLPTPKNVLLEEFTGIHCGYCPQGHAIAQSMKTASKRVFAIAYHAGYYANPNSDEPDFRTEEGDAICSFFEVSGFPSGMVNRDNQGGEAADCVLSRSLWVTRAKEILKEQEAPVNLMVKSEYDGHNRQLKVHVEGYCRTAETDGLMLSVAWTQDGLTSWQNGGNMGLDYVHHDMLRDYLTPVWGDSLTEARQGQFFSRDYSVTLPETLKETEVRGEQIHVLAFVSSGKMQVQQVEGGRPELKNMQLPVAASINAPTHAISGNYGFQFFELGLQNLCADTIRQATFDVTVNGQTQEVDWKGTVMPMENQEIRLDCPYTLAGPEEKNNYEIRLKEVNGTEVETQALSGTFSHPTAATPTIVVGIKTNLEAADNRYRIRNEQGQTVWEFGPYEDGIVTETRDTLTLEADKVYCMEVTDQWGNGIYSPKGTLVIRSIDNKLVKQVYDISGWGLRTFFITNKVDTGIDSIRTNDGKPEDGEWFGLDGRRISKHPTRGIAIHRKTATEKARKMLRP
ncbi:MAG: Omp28-related outer membrane protein [Prevotella sp.]|nr:Omp28-related outer membrane protein [Prevotella sp.]MDY5656744.1 Omp28-related outer membrane protein [Prevotella sp.]